MENTPIWRTHREEVKEQHQGAKQGALHVMDVGNGGQSMHRGDLLGVGRLLGAQDPEDGRALGVADVVQLLVAGLAQDIVYVGRQVILAHLVEGKVPELLVIAVEAGVVLGVAVATRVAHPNVVAEIGEHVT